jgi:hypothetical protein
MSVIESGGRADPPRQVAEPRRGLISRKKVIRVFARYGFGPGSCGLARGPDKEQRAAMLTVAVQEYIADVRSVFGKEAE